MFEHTHQRPERATNQALSSRRNWGLASCRTRQVNEEQKTPEMSQVGMNLMFERAACVDTEPAVHWTDEVENDHSHGEYRDLLWTDDNPEDEWWRPRR